MDTHAHGATNGWPSPASLLWLIGGGARGDARARGSACLKQQPQRSAKGVFLLFRYRETCRTLLVWGAGGAALFSFDRSKTRPHTGKRPPCCDPLLQTKTTPLAESASCRRTTNLCFFWGGQPSVFPRPFLDHIQQITGLHHTHTHTFLHFYPSTPLFDYNSAHSLTATKTKKRLLAFLLPLTRTNLYFLPRGMRVHGAQSLRAVRTHIALATPVRTLLQHHQQSQKQSQKLFFHYHSKSLPPPFTTTTTTTKHEFY